MKNGISEQKLIGRRPVSLARKIVVDTGNPHAGAAALEAKRLLQGSPGWAAAMFPAARSAVYVRPASKRR